MGLARERLLAVDTRGKRHVMVETLAWVLKVVRHPCVCEFPSEVSQMFLDIPSRYAYFDFTRVKLLAFRVDGLLPFLTFSSLLKCKGDIGHGRHSELCLQLFLV